MIHKIEQGIPLPLGSRECYPLQGMKVGESIFVALSEGRTTHQLMACMRVSSYRFSERKHSLRSVTVDGQLGVRIWRTA